MNPFFGGISPGMIPQIRWDITKCQKEIEVLKELMEQESRLSLKREYSCVIRNLERRIQTGEEILSSQQIIFLHDYFPEESTDDSYIDSPTSFITDSEYSSLE
mmetsp:Transcript_10340/g.15448  ORF Transcript_10340/g.15448 Transcript_10340/m.15448 type:complete len:103 (+) Transcript_10340:7-315(+)